MNKFLSQETIDHHTLSKLSGSKVVRRVTVVGKKEGWQISIQYAAVEQYLSATNSKQVRTFRKLETAIFYLKNLGIEEVTVKAADYNPNVKGSRVRPDRSEALKKVYAVAKVDSSTSRSKSKKPKK